MEELNKLDTEQRNPATANIDRLPTEEMVRLINQEDHHCAEAVALVLPEIARSVDLIEGQLRRGGRLFYVGAGTSGRLGVLDAAECPPTYGVPPDLVIGLIAGGPSALLKAVEGAEDSPSLGRQDLIDHGFSEIDALVGIAASGRTPYVLGAMDYAREVGAPVMALTCCRNSEMSRHADVTMAPVPGPEVVTGSKLGKVYGNLMVDVQATNQKLVNRAIRIVCTSARVSESEAEDALKRCGFSCKTAIVMLLLNVEAPEAERLLAASDGRIARAIENGR